MWLMVQFDVPMESKCQRLAYRRLRKELRFLGFNALQKSVYLRWEDNDAAAETKCGQLAGWIPDEGSLSILRLSERSMKSASFYENGKPVSTPDQPEKLILL